MQLRPTTVAQLQRTTPVRLRSTRFRWIKMFLHHSLWNFLHQITEKLDDKNFLLWQQQIKPVIAALGLNYFVVTPQIPPQYLSDEDHDLHRINPLFLIKQKQDQFLLVWLQPMLSSSMLPRVLGSRNSYQVCDKIYAYFHHQMRTKARQLRPELRQTTLDNCSVFDFLSQIKVLIDALASVGDVQPIASTWMRF